MELPRGMKDFENTEIQKIEYIREKFLSTSKIFGFELMEPSTIELMSTIEAKSGTQIRVMSISLMIKVTEKFH